MLTTATRRAYDVGMTTTDESPGVAWGVLVRMPYMRRGEWLTPSGHLTSRRVLAGIVRGDEGRQLAERIAAQVEAASPGAQAKARRFW